MPKNGIPEAAKELGKLDFLATSLGELRTIDNRFHNATRSKTIAETMENNEGEWPENGPTMTILGKLLEIELFLWTNREESDEVLQPKVWEAIELSRKVSGGEPELNSNNRRSAVLSVTVVHTGLVNCWCLKTTRRNLTLDQRNPWQKHWPNSKEKTVEFELESAPLGIANHEEDFLALEEAGTSNNISMGTPVEAEFVELTEVADVPATKNADAPANKKVDDPAESDGASGISVDKAQSENVDAPATNNEVNNTVESDVASEISVEIRTKTEKGVWDDVLCSDAVKSHVNDRFFLLNGKIKLQMDAIRQEMKEMEVRLGEDYDRKLSMIQQDMLKNAKKVTSDEVLESEEVHETLKVDEASKVDEAATEAVINVSSEVDDTNEKLVDNLQEEIEEEQAEAQAEEANIEEPSTSKATKVEVKRKKFTRKRARNTDSDSEEESKGPVVRRSSRKRVTVNYRALTQGVSVNKRVNKELVAYRQLKEYDMEYEVANNKKLADEDRKRLKKEFAEAQVAMESEKKAMESEQKAMGSEQKTMGKEVPVEVLASENEGPDSPPSPAYEDILSTGKGEKPSEESQGSLPELVLLSQQQTQPDEGLENEITRELTIEQVRVRVRNWKPEESGEADNTLTIDTDEDIDA